MSRAKGYKCFNIKCGSCIGKTLCGEPEDTALGCVGRVIGKSMTNAQKIRSMSDGELAECLFQIGYDNGWSRKEYAIEWLQQPAGEEDKHENLD